MPDLTGGNADPAEERRGTQPLALRGGRLIASSEASPVDPATVLIENGRIAKTGRLDEIAIPKDARLLECAGLTVLAGFQNSHVHFTEEKWAGAGELPGDLLEAQVKEMLTRYGFTTAVDTASHLANTLQLRARIQTGEISGPRILTAGIALYPANGIPFYVREALPPDLLHLLPQPSTAAQALDTVRANLAGGADIIKLFTGSWVSREEVVPMPQDVARAAVSEAHRQGRLVFTHPSDVRGLEVALDAGVDVLAHAIDDVQGLATAHLDRMLAQDMALIPTLKLLAPDGRQEVLDQVTRYSQMDGRILFGTDVGFLSDYNPAQEYELMEAAGLTWRQILASLTSEPARLFKESGMRGELSPGMDGDAVLLEGDPLSGASAFAAVRYTIKAGQVIYDRMEERT